MNISRRDVLRLGAGYALACGVARADDKPAAPPAPPATKPDPYVDAVFVNGAPPMPADGSFTIAVMPDTQNYTGMRFAKQFHAQTE